MENPRSARETPNRKSLPLTSHRGERHGTRCHGRGSHSGRSFWCQLAGAGGGGVAFALTNNPAPIHQAIAKLGFQSYTVDTLTGGIMTATAIAPSNIALVKYWGKRNIELNLPATPSLSMTLDKFQTQTTVIMWGTPSDKFYLNGKESSGNPKHRVCRHLSLIDPNRPPCHVISENNFPTAAGLASSASAFAALTMAAVAAAGKSWGLYQQSAIARQGSGSACRSFWGGFVTWEMGEKDDGQDCHGKPLVPESYWDVSLLVAVIDSGPKSVGSTQGMIRSANTSPYYDPWMNTAQTDLETAREAVKSRDLNTLGQVMEQSMNKMHGVMMTSNPPIHYKNSGSVATLNQVAELRESGIECYATMDAGPNVKILCATEDAGLIEQAISPHCERVYILKPGPGAKLV